MEGSGAELRALTLNSSTNRLAMKRATGGTHGSPMDLFIIFTLEEEVCVFEAELQKCDYLLYGHVGPLWGVCGPSVIFV